jgi:hypothetical protein
MSLPPEQYAFLSDAIYDKPMPVHGYIESDTHRYEVLYVSPPSATNYRGAVVQDSDTGQLIVTNKGTNPKNIHDYNADLGMGMMGAPTQWPEAAATMRWALEHARENGIPITDISTTGHSLGGALSQLQAVMPGSSGVHAETFNAYGALTMARHLGMDTHAAQDRVVNHRMYHDPVSAIAEPIGRTVNYMDESDYERHRQGSLSPLGEAVAIKDAHGIGNFWDKEHNQPAAVFAHNYMQDLNHRPLDDLPRGVPLDLSVPWRTLGQQPDAPLKPLAASASADDIFHHLCAAMNKDDDTFMQALRQVGQTDMSREFHAQAAERVDTQDKVTALETQLQQTQQQMAQARQAGGPVMSLGM